MATVYILEFVDRGGFYIGSTNNLSRRLAEHRWGKTKSIKYKGKFLLVYTEEFDELINARIRERQIKSFKGGNAFKKLVKSPLTYL